MDTKLVELENSLIVVFPARLQKDPYTKMQFKTKEYEGGVESIIFDLKCLGGKLKNFEVFLVGGKYFVVRVGGKDEKCKKIKDVVKYLETKISEVEKK